MDNLIKPSLMLGGICGIFFGIILLIPFLAPFMFFLAFLLAGILVIVFLKKTNSIGILTLQNGCFIGALAGFGSVFTASIIYIPLAYLFGLIFSSYTQGFGINKALSLTGYDLLVVSMLVFFIATLSAVMNAFTGMVTAYVYEKIEQKPLNFQEYIGQEHLEETDNLSDYEQADHIIE